MFLYLLHNWADVFQLKRTELVIFEKIVKIEFKHFKDDAGMTFMRKTLKSAHIVELFRFFHA